MEGDDTEQALAIAGRALRHRDRSRQALEERLAAAGVAPGEADRTLETLTRAGLVDDTRLAERLAASLAERGLGDEAILARLEAEGIAAEERESAVAALEPEERRAVSLARRETRRTRTQLGALLTRRGFGEEAVEATVASLDGLRRPEVP